LRYKLLFIICLAFLLTACSTQEESSNKKANAEVKDEPYTREITEEEQKYIQMVLDKDYSSLEKLTENSAEEVKLDYNKIAFAFKKYGEAQELEKKGIDESVIKDVQEVEIKYYFALDKLKSVKFIPSKIQKQVTELEKALQERENYYKPIVDKYTEQREEERKQQQIEDEKREFYSKANSRTENPRTVSIGMTREEVLTEGWGRPRDVNKTTTANTVSEQWVYSGYKYLYFEDGILTTIQD